MSRTSTYLQEILKQDDYCLHFAPNVTESTQLIRFEERGIYNIPTEPIGTMPRSKATSPKCSRVTKLSKPVRENQSKSTASRKQPCTEEKMRHNPQVATIRFGSVSPTTSTNYTLRPEAAPWRPAQTRATRDVEESLSTPRTILSTLTHPRAPRMAARSPTVLSHQVLQTTSGTIIIEWDKEAVHADDLVMDQPRAINYKTHHGVHQRAEFTPGILIRAFHYEEAYDRNACTSPNSAACFFKVPKGKRAAGITLCSKERLMIIHRCFDDHYTALPIFTYKQQGITGRSNAFRDEHMSVCGRSMDMATFEAQNSLPVLELEYLHQNIRIPPESTVHLTHPISRHYTQRCVIEGYLTKRSFSKLKLCTLFNENAVPFAFRRST